jgi:hypothetical protein
MSNPNDPNDKTKENQYAPGDPNQPPAYEFEPEDFVENGDEEVLTDPPETVEESFQPPSKQEEA